jgi:hypothetical protein
MSNKLSPLDAWLTGENIASEADELSWDPGFDAERSVVVAKLGLITNYFSDLKILYHVFFITFISCP